MFFSLFFSSFISSIFSYSSLFFALFLFLIPLFLVLRPLFVPCSSSSYLFLVPPFPHLHSSVSAHFHSIYPISSNSPLFLFTVVNSPSLPSLPSLPRHLPYTSVHTCLSRRLLRVISLSISSFPVFLFLAKQPNEYLILLEISPVASSTLLTLPVNL